MHKLVLKLFATQGIIEIDENGRLKIFDASISERRKFIRTRYPMKSGLLNNQLYLLNAEWPKRPPTIFPFDASPLIANVKFIHSAFSLILNLHTAQQIAKLKNFLQGLLLHLSSPTRLSTHMACIFYLPVCSKS